jgi:hypothetical protein
MAGEEPTLYERMNARLALLPVRFRASSDGLAPGLLSTLPDVSGSGNHATAAGSLRPTVTGDEIVFAGAQRMVTPAFSMGAASSGFAVVRFTAMFQGAFQFSTLNTHTSLIVQNTGSGDFVRLRSTPVGDIKDPVTFPRSLVVAWAQDGAGGAAYFDGVYRVAAVAGSPAAAAAVLSIGDITGGIWPLVGGIKELCFIDAKVGTEDLALMSSAALERWT